MTCDWCGRVFPADARACLEGGITAVEMPAEGEEWKGEQPPCMDPKDLTPEERAQLKSELGLDDKQLDQLLTTGEVEGLGSIVCLPCQEEAEKALDEEEKSSE